MGGGHLSRPDFGMPQPDPAHPLTEFYLLAQQALEKGTGPYRQLCPAGALCGAPCPGTAYLSGGGKGVPAPFPGAKRGLHPAACPRTAAAAVQQPPCDAGGGTCRPAAYRGVHPHGGVNAAAAALYVDRPPAAGTGLPGGADGGADGGGCGADGHRPRRTGQKACADNCRKVLAAPPPGGELSCPAGGTAAKGIPEGMRVALLFWAYSCYTYAGIPGSPAHRTGIAGAPEAAGAKTGKNCFFSLPVCNERDRSTVY